MARKAFWRPYTDGVQVNEGNTLMKADNLKSIPKFLLHVFQKGPTYDSYLVESRIEGIGRNVTKKGKSALRSWEIHGSIKCGRCWKAERPVEEEE